jgi:hypothetical protein|tara:strand:+ start:69 stop:365 length:297 start_codon:yes stop_codon:yes gene_type:complete
MEDLDRKFEFVARHTTKGSAVTHREAIVFLAKDNIVPSMLVFYRDECEKQGVSKVQLHGINLLIERVDRWRAENKKQLKLPDVDAGREHEQVCKVNKI